VATSAATVGANLAKSRRHHDIGRENDHREKFCHGTSLVGADLRLTARITSLLER